MTRRVVFLLSLTLLGCGRSGGEDSVADAAPFADATGPSDVAPRTDAPPPPLRWPPPPWDPAPPPSARVQLRGLTATELRNTVRDVLGVEVLAGELRRLEEWATYPDSGFPGPAPFDERTQASLFDGMNEIARRAVARLGDLLPARCRPLPTAADERACAGEFIGALGRRAFRRPVDREEAAALLALYEARRMAGATFPEAARVVIAGLLLSPHFLYHGDVVEPPRPGSGSARLDSFSLAARLSYGFWAAPPDPLLEEHADLGLLRDSASFEREVRRLMASERALPVFQDFVRKWLMIDELALQQRDPGPRGTLPFQQLAPAMLAETDRLVAEVFQGERAPLETLFLTTTTTIDPVLAPLYGLPPAAGPGPMKVMLAPRQRAGVLTHPSFLAAHASPEGSNPVRRGIVILRRLLCMDIPDEPPGIDIPPPAPLSPNATTRERFEAHAAPVCTACHQLIDPPGFAFEHYDQLGRFRTHENGKPVDASGTLRATQSTLTFQDAPSLVKELLRTPELGECLTKQWFRYLLRRKEETVDGPNLQHTTSLFEKSGRDLREMMAAIVRTPSFTHRALAPGEGAP